MKLATIDFDITIEDFTKQVSLHFPLCSDITLHWRGLWNLGNMLGQNAYLFMDEHISSPGQDEADADVIRLGRTADQLAVLYFRQPTSKLTWNRNAALRVAEKMCGFAEKIAGAE